MAKQIDGSRLTGTIGGITYYKVGDKYYARKSSSLTRKQVLKDPNYANARKNMMEFGRAANASALLRNCFREIIALNEAKDLHRRLNRELMAVLRKDDAHDHGQRTIAGGDISLLEDFDLVEESPLLAQFRAPWNAGYNRRTGLAGIDIPEFDPLTDLKAPRSATHFKISFAAASVDFNANRFEVNRAESATLPMNEPVASIQLCCRLAHHPDRAYLLVAALQFLQIVNGKEYFLSGGATAIVSASH